MRVPNSDHGHPCCYREGTSVLPEVMPQMRGFLTLSSIRSARFLPYSTAGRLVFCFHVAILIEHSLP